MCWLELEYCLCIKHDHVICLRIHSCIILSCAKALFPFSLLSNLSVCMSPREKVLRYLYYTYTKVNTVSWTHTASPYTIHCPCFQLFISLARSEMQYVSDSHAYILFLFSVGPVHLKNPNGHQGYEFLWWK